MSTNPETVASAYLVNVSVPANSLGSAERMRDQLLQMFAGVKVVIVETKAEAAEIEREGAKKTETQAAALAVSGEAISEFAFSVGDTVIDTHTQKTWTVRKVDEHGFHLGEGIRSHLAPWTAARYFHKIAAAAGGPVSIERLLPEKKDEPSAPPAVVTDTTPDRRVDRMVNSLIDSGVDAAKVAAAAGNLVAPEAPNAPDRVAIAADAAAAKLAKTPKPRVRKIGKSTVAVKPKK